MTDYILVNVEDMNKEHPDTFGIHSREDRDSLQPGDIAKLLFEYTSGLPTERMWVQVKESKDGTYLGELDNVPCNDLLDFGDEVEFGPENVADIFDLDKEAGLS